MTKKELINAVVAVRLMPTIDPPDTEALSGYSSLMFAMGYNTAIREMRAKFEAKGVTA